MSLATFKVSKVSPVAQASTNAYVVVAGSALTTAALKSLAYTIKIATQTVNWKVYGANISDFTDEVEVLSEAAVVAGAASSYAVTTAPYAYYRVKIKSAVDNVHGTATVTGIAKGG